MCGQLIVFPTPEKWSSADMDMLERSFQRLIKEAREFRELADSLPSAYQKQIAEAIRDHLCRGD